MKLTWLNAQKYQIEVSPEERAEIDEALRQADLDHPNSELELRFIYHGDKILGWRWCEAHPEERN